MYQVPGLIQCEPHQLDIARVGQPCHAIHAHGHIIDADAVWKADSHDVDGVVLHQPVFIQHPLRPHPGYLENAVIQRLHRIFHLGTGTWHSIFQHAAA